MHDSFNGRRRWHRADRAAGTPQHDFPTLAQLANQPTRHAAVVRVRE